jgi:transcriptional regulator with XRE-family HTH domain
VTEHSHLEQLGQAIQELRQALGWTQGRLSEMAAADRSQVSRLEAGERLVSAPVLARIAHALGTTTDDLLARAGYIRVPSQEQQAAAGGHLLRLLEHHPALRALVDSWPHLSEDQRTRLIDFWLFEQVRAQAHPAALNGADPASPRPQEMAQALQAVEARLVSQRDGSPQ